MVRPAEKMTCLAVRVGVAAATTVVFLVLTVFSLEVRAQAAKGGPQVSKSSTRQQGKAGRRGRMARGRRRPKSSSDCRSTIPEPFAATRSLIP